MNIHHHSILSPDCSKLFSNSFTIDPKKAFLVSGTRTLSYGQLYNLAQKLSGLFAVKNLKAHDRVILVTRDEHHAVTIFLSLLQNNITPIILDPETPAFSSQPILEKVKPHALFIDRDILQDWQPDIDKDLIIPISTTPQKTPKLFNKLLKKKTPIDTSSYPALLESIEVYQERIYSDNEALGTIVFTSGTTSAPKGVCLSQSNICSHLQTLTKQFGYDQSSRILNILPLHHVDGLIQGPLLALYNGATVFRPFSFAVHLIEQLLDRIYTDRISHFIAVPTILNLILQFSRNERDAFRTEDFQCIVSAAAPLEAALWQNFEETFQTTVCNLYGLTETVTGGLFSGPTQADHKYGTVGKPVDCEVRIVNEQGHDVNTCQKGELLIKGDNIMKGYYDSPEETKKVLNDGWFSTGDLAVCDNEGFYTISGRKKDVIISGGFTIHPEEITEAVNTHPDVLESFTFGIQDSLLYEQIVTAIIPNKADLTEENIITYCRTLLSPEKIPQRLFFIDSFPKGPSGKILHKKLKEIICNHQPQTPAVDLQETVNTIAARCFKTSTDMLGPHSSPDNTPGWDSLTHLHLVTEIEKRMKINLTPKQILNITCLHDVCSYIESEKR